MIASSGNRDGDALGVLHGLPNVSDIEGQNSAQRPAGNKAEEGRAGAADDDGPLVIQRTVGGLNVSLVIGSPHRNPKLVADLTHRLYLVPATKPRLKPASIPAVMKGGLGDVEEFLRERCDLRFQFWAPLREVLVAYEGWCRARNSYGVGRELFHQVLLGRGIRKGRGRRINGRQVRSLEGLCLKPVREASRA